MEQGLSDYRTDSAVVTRCIGCQNLVAKLGPETSLRTRTLAPSRDLSSIVRATTALIESTVPLKPSVGIAIDDPTTAFPHAERAPAFHTVFIHHIFVIHRCQATHRYTIDPVFRNCVFQYFFRVVVNIRYCRMDRTEVGPSEGSCPQHI